ncbi:unnamed protein product [Mytilus edulis]|uniref:Retrotransposon gag domain-containing protein n=1 Tax=Mytilus edulis TaxID=6550 RepID=A0A8S3T346_MYTED|nr:unnamed protein product [Mytilus edulis]
MSKLILLMDATLDQLQSVEGIDNEMAIQILEVRDASHFIDFNAVSGITGVPKSTLKKYFIEPGMLFLYQKLHNEIAESRQELKQDIANVTSGLHEVDKKASKIDNMTEKFDDLCARMTKMEQTQLMGSTIQFKNPLPLLQDDHHEQAEQSEKKFGAFGATIDTLIAQKNQQAEEKFGTKPKTFSTPASSATYPDFSKVSPISKPTGLSSLGESFTTNTSLQDDMYASAASTLKVSTATEAAYLNHVKPNTEIHVEQGPSAPLFVTSNMVPVQSTLEVKSDPSFIQHGQLDNQSKDGQGPLASTSNTSTNEIHNNVSQGYTGQGTLAPSSFYNPIIVQGSAIPNKPPFWSYNVPPPGVQQNNGSTVPSTAVFHPGSNKDTSNIPSIPVHWNTPVVMPSHVQSVNNTSVQNKSESTQERHRGRGRKRCQRESSSSSDESIDRESSRWKESHARERSKSPQLPKMPVFTGSGNLSWEAFVYQFERTANRRNWDDAKKTCRFLDCLSEVALEYARRSHISRYDDLRKYMKRRFSKKEEASAARRQLQYIRQLDGETIEEYAERVHFLTMDGYYRSNNDIIDQIGTEAFLRGCQEKEAARIVIEKNPRTINESLKWIKSSLANQKAIYGARKSYSQLYTQRQVTFSDVGNSDHSPQRPSALQYNQRFDKEDGSLKSNIEDLVSIIGQLLKDRRSNISTTQPLSQSNFRSPQNSRFPSPQRRPKPYEEQPNISPSFQRTSSSHTPEDQYLNKTGSGH